MLSGFIRDELLKKNHAEVTSLMNLLHTQVEQTEHLLNELLSWGKSRTQKNIVHWAPVCLDNVFNELVTLHSVRIQEKAIVLETQVSPNLVLFADHYLLKTILRNLLTNAIKFSFRNGKIILNGYSNSGEVVIQVQDEGRGIEPAILDKLLGGESYITTPGTHNESGSGLGLLICKEYVRLHGGTFRIESSPGKGTRITLSFPGT